MKKSIDIAILSKNSQDEHLNIFWQYNGSPHLENNITKAFINTFDSLTPEEKKSIFNDLFCINLNNKSNCSFICFLQKQPTIEIEKIQKENRILFAFSPTGKTWGNTNVATNNPSLIKESIREAITISCPSMAEEDIAKMVDIEFNKTKNIIDNKGGSIPDAWIFVLIEGVPYCCVALENKLYDLNPYQLNNHCKKSLKTDDNIIIYSSYEHIIDLLINYENYVVEEFIRYLFLLGYYNISNLMQIDGCKNENVVQKYADIRCVQVLDNIAERLGCKAEYHRGWMWKINTNNDYNNEVGLYYTKTDGFNVTMYFGSTQSSSKKLYEHFSSIGNILPDNCKCRGSFHFQYKGIGRNVKYTYYQSNCGLVKYIDFWIKNKNLIQQMDKEARADVICRMNIAGLLNNDDYKRLLTFSNSYDKALNICPEVGITINIPFEDAVQLDKIGKLEITVLTRIINVFKNLDIEDKIFY